MKKIPAILLVMLLLPVILLIFFITIYKVSGINFEIGLENKSYVLADKFFYKRLGLRPLDVVVFISDVSGVNLFGRVLAGPNDTIIYADDALLINNKKVDLKYLNPSLSFDYPAKTITLPKNQYLIVQAVSNRYAIKIVDLNRIKGKFLFVD